MKNKMFLKFVIAASLLQTAYVPMEAQAAGGGSCSQKIVAKCKSDGQSAGQTGFSGGSGMYGNASTGSAETLAAGARVGAAAKDCKASAKQCDQCPEAEREQCKKDVEGAAGTMEAQSAGMGDAGAAMGAIAGMMAGILPMLMQKKKDDEKKNNDSALRPDGSIDCSKNDAYMFTQCDEQLSTACKKAMTDPRCVNFAGRYCTASTGTGSGTPYCNTVAAYNFCSPGGRDTCPSCLQLQMESSEACQLDPAQCLAQNSAAELQKARGKCPQDPIFKAMPAASTSPVVVAPGTNPVAGGGVNNPNLPPVVLPKSLSSSAANDSATRDAYANNPTAGTGTFSASSAGGSGSAIRDAASAAPIRTASVGPAPDVQGPYGPSLFATSSQVIRSHCAAGKFLNCP